jgi:hypothetical protein
MANKMKCAKSSVAEGAQVRPTKAGEIWRRQRMGTTPGSGVDRENAAAGGVTGIPNIAGSMALRCITSPHDYRTDFVSKHMIVSSSCRDSSELPLASLRVTVLVDGLFPFNIGVFATHGRQVVQPHRARTSKQTIMSQIYFVKQRMTDDVAASRQSNRWFPNIRLVKRSPDCFCDNQIR